MSEVLFVVSSARPGRESEYVEWYMKRHLPDMKAVPGVSDGHFYCATGALPQKRWGYASRYELDRPIADVLSTLLLRAGGPDMQLSDSIDSPSVVMLGGTPQRPRVAATGGTSALNGDLCLVLADSMTALNCSAWCNGDQIPDAIAAEGVYAAQPFLAKQVAGSPSPWTHIILYDVAAGKGGSALRTLTCGSGAWRIPPPSASNADGLYIGLFERIA